MSKTTVFILAFASFCLSTSPPAKCVGECPTVPQCWTPSCGLELYCSNRDYFGYYFRKRIKKLKLKNRTIRAKAKQIRADNKKKIQAFRKRLKLAKRKRKQARKQARKKRRQIRKALRQSLKKLRRNRQKYLKKFTGRLNRFKKCKNGGCGGGKSGRSDVDVDADDGEEDEEEEEDSSDFDQDDGDKDDDLDDIIAGKEPMDELRDKCDRNISILGQFLQANRGSGLGDILLYGDSSDCDSGCQSNYSDLYGTWIVLVRNLRQIYKRKLAAIRKCSHRKRKMRLAFLSLCRPYLPLIRDSLIGYYDYLLGSAGCDTYIW